MSDAPVPYDLGCVLAEMDTIADRLRGIRRRSEFLTGRLLGTVAPHQPEPGGNANDSNILSRFAQQCSDTRALLDEIEYAVTSLENGLGVKDEPVPFAPVPFAGAQAAAVSTRSLLQGRR